MHSISRRRRTRKVGTRARVQDSTTEVESLSGPPLVTYPPWRYHLCVDKEDGHWQVALVQWWARSCGSESCIPPMTSPTSSGVRLVGARRSDTTNSARHSRSSHSPSDPGRTTTQICRNSRLSAGRNFIAMARVWARLLDVVSFGMAEGYCVTCDQTLP